VSTISSDRLAANTMKLLSAQLMLAVLATLSLAVPMPDQQVPLGRVRDSRRPSNHLPPQTTPLRTPLVVDQPPVKASVLVSDPQREAHFSTSTAAAAATGTPSSSSSPGSTWEWFSAAFRKETAGAPHSCFCAGVSVCCHSAEGLGCNYGVCGI